LSIAQANGRQAEYQSAQGQQKVQVVLWAVYEENNATHVGALVWHDTKKALVFADQEPNFVRLRK
jgi:hypothetical protein